MDTQNSYNAIAVANETIKLAHRKGATISNLLLQKLLYFLQGHTLHVFEEPLFYNEIEAWDHGPVVPDVYFAIKKRDLEDDDFNLKGVIDDTTVGMAQVEKMIEAVYNTYSVYDPWDLVAITHKKGTPWHIVKKTGGKVIPVSLIRDEFDRRIKSQKRRRRYA